MAQWMGKVRPEERGLEMLLLVLLYKTVNTQSKQDSAGYETEHQHSVGVFGLKNLPCS